MRYIFYGVCLSLLTTSVRAQSPFVPLNADYYHLIDRLEIRQNRWADGFHSTIKPYNRQSIIQLTDSLAAHPGRNLSDTDYFNYGYLRDDSWEWVPSATDSLRPDPLTNHLLPTPGPGDSERPFLKYFYRKKADFYHVQSYNFDFHASPVISFGIGDERISNAGERMNAGADRPFVNTRGLEVRGSIGRKLGFYTFLADNQVVYPYYVQQYGSIYRQNDAGGGFAPGEGFVKQYGRNGADYFSARGYITFNALKIINVQFGHDRNFIGNGFRSLYLSDNSPPYLFLKLTTRLGRRVQYTNLFTELQNTQDSARANGLIPQKYAAFHHLSVNVGNHFNFGVFEGEVFSRDRLDLNYLNPIIFYRYVESYRGSADNAIIGLDFKGNFLSHFLAYSQILLDEFRLRDLLAAKGSVTNKFAVQVGLKYIDAFGLPNLDLQVEANAARPYTYSHKASGSFGQGQTNYAHYSQPLAHPLGGNFEEVLGIVRYQNKRLFATGMFGLMRYGTDPPGVNYGGNILLDYKTNFREDGNYIGQGRLTIVTYADARLSYMIRHNVFLEGRYLYRYQDSQYRPNSYLTNLASVGLRWNLPYRNWVF